LPSVLPLQGVLIHVLAKYLRKVIEKIKIKIDLKIIISCTRGVHVYVSQIIRKKYYLRIGIGYQNRSFVVFITYLRMLCYLLMIFYL